jgi:hypothetical protein
MLHEDLLTAFDPARLAVALGITPDPWQEELLRGTGPTLLLTCRQAGKSTIGAVMALHRAVYFPGSLVLLLSPSLRQSGELFRKVTTFAVKIEKDAAPVQAESALRIEFKNGSRIVSLPGSETTVRGFSNVALLVVDEASRVDDSLYFSIRPMLAVSGGRIACLTTPWGRRGFFYSAWSESASEWQRIAVPATECSRISADFLDAERRSMPARWFRQEYECSFEDLADAAFGADLVAGLVDPDITPLFGPDAETRLADVLPMAAHGGER